MANPKIIQLLSNFSKEEIKDLGKFISSPYNNSRKDVEKFYSLVKGLYPDFERHKMYNEDFFKKLYPKQKFDRKVISRLYSFLYRIALEFVKTDFLRKEKHISNYILLEALNNIHNFNIYVKELKYTDKALAAIKPGGQQLYMRSIINATACSVHRDSGDRRKYLSLLPRTIEYIICDFLTKTIATYCNIYSPIDRYRELIISPEIFSILVPEQIFEFLQLLKQNGNEYYPFIEFYYHRLMCTKEPENEIHYMNLKKCLFVNADKFDEDSLPGMVVHLENYVLTKNKLKPDKRYFSEIFDLYKFEIEHFELPTQFERFFYSFVTYSLLLNKTEYAEEFIRNHKHKLRDTLKKEIISICDAKLHFHKKEYGRSLELLAKINTNSEITVSDLKDLYLKIYYETGDYDSLLLQTDSYLHYLRTTKDLKKPSIQKKRNFINTLTKLVRCKNTGGFDAAALTNEIRMNKELPFDSMEWLKEKAEELC